jgi:hypothetical protein
MKRKLRTARKVDYALSGDRDLVRTTEQTKENEGRKIHRRGRV